ncbi:unnamed protein product [Camellia sinensis]
MQSNNFDPRAAAANFPSGVQAYLAGLTFALAISPCSTAVLATLLGYVAASKFWQGASCYDSFPTLRPVQRCMGYSCSSSSEKNKNMEFVISGGWRHTMALTSDGKLYGWGWNKLAVLGGSLLGTFLSEKAGLMELGPLEEKYATRGDIVSPITVLGKLSFTVGFLHGDTSGLVGLCQDNVRVGDVIIKDQVFTEATKEGLFMFLLAQFDGIIGLGFQDIAVGQVSPVWYNMVKQGLVSRQVFSLWLNRDPNSKIGGEIVFGGVDWRHFRGDHTFAPIAQNAIQQEQVSENKFPFNAENYKLYEEVGEGVSATVHRALCIPLC